MSPNRAPRISDFEYVGFLRYFLTVCVHPRRPVFADAPSGRWVRDELLRTSERFAFSITAYCVMHDHVHVLAEATREDSHLVKFVSAWKQTTGFYWKRRTNENLWQQGFFDHVLRDDEDERGVIRYIVENPVRAGYVSSPKNYPLSGSAKYTYEQIAEAMGDWSPHDKNKLWRV
jgi:putative transposase